MSKYLTLENLGWFILSLVSLMLGMGAISKIFGTEEMVNNFTFMNLTDYRSFVGFGELIGIALLIYPRTSIFGAVLISCFMSGAVMAHLSLMGGQGVLSPIIVGILTWTGHCLREYFGYSVDYVETEEIY